jgi:dethiobiotin synthetase
MSGYFITGTDTNVGKTLVAAALTLAHKGYYWKPIQSSLANTQGDTKTVQQLTELSDEHFFPNNYALQADLSPNQAAALENITINMFACTLAAPRYPLIVEGAGGVLVPLNAEHNMLDLMEELALPIVIVSRGQLGTINHTLLTIQALHHRHLKIHGIVYNGELHAENQKNIEEWSGVRTLFHLPPFPEVTKNNFQNWVRQHHDTIVEALPCL